MPPLLLTLLLVLICPPQPVLTSALLTQDECVWPAYLKAHRPLFLNGDVENGAIDPETIEGVKLFEAKELGMEKMVVQSLEAVYEMVKSGGSAERCKKP